MIEYVACKITKNLLDENIIIAEEQGIYRYGVELLVSTLWNLGLVVLISMLMRNIRIGMIYFSVLATLRVRSGGYHASSYLKCSVVYILTFLCVIAGVQLMHLSNMNSTCLIIILLFSMVYIWVNAPVLHNRVMADEEIKYAKKSAGKSCIIWILIAYAMMYINVTVAYSIVSSIVVVVAYMLLGKVLQR